MLQMPGVKLAARPWLFPKPASGDTDIRNRLKPLRHLEDSQRHSTKASWVRKATSRCSSYVNDFPLFASLHDCCLAHQISTVVSTSLDRETTRALARRSCIQDARYRRFLGTPAVDLKDLCGRFGLPNPFFTAGTTRYKANAEYRTHNAPHRSCHQPYSPDDGAAAGQKSHRRASAARESIV